MSKDSDKLIFLREPISRLALYPHEGLRDSSTISEIITFLNWHNTSSVSLTADKKLVGIFTEGDIMSSIVENQNVFNEPVYNFMSKAPTALSLDSMIGEALFLMYSRGTRHVPIVTEDNIPYAVMSMRDITKHLILGIDEEDLNFFKKSA